MMSSLGSEKARGPREKALPAATHTSQPQKQIQVRNLNHLIKKKKFLNNLVVIDIYNQPTKRCHSSF